ncbi:hypothetical protein [Hylemonella gracilis]|jgi:hypothetical protein|uniref:hypothetical protein n=1 Tax=Hylemonella gracilis TaxID=80880 RepID=UPI001A9505F2|nr:hypothetical protein [Hylemonella gracilis]
MKDLNRPYTVRLYDPQGDGDAQGTTAREHAQRRFAQVLEAHLGDADLVLPVRGAYLRIAQAYGDPPNLDALTDAEREIAQQWLAAESAALESVFGPLRGMSESFYEIVPTVR